ncbi:MAG: phasin family protein [Chitinispirillaceae bacterium]|nr:phasin family protein [Chitinispirillaceae bacterium]
MVELLKKSVYATIGIALMTREKAEEIGKKVAEEARLSESEGKQFVEELLSRADETRSAFEKTVAKQVEAVLHKVNLPTRSEVEALELRLRKLEAAQQQEPV